MCIPSVARGERERKKKEYEQFNICEFSLGGILQFAISKEFAFSMGLFTRRPNWDYRARL